MPSPRTRSGRLGCGPGARVSIPNGAGRGPQRGLKKGGAAKSAAAKGIRPRDRDNRCGKLRESLNIVAGQVVHWDKAGSGHLKQFGFDLELVRKWVDYGEDALLAFTDRLVCADLHDLLEAHTSLEKIIAGTPDPEQDEKQFYSFMTKHAAKLVDRQKPLEKACDAIERAAGALNKTVADVDPNGLVAKGRQLCSDVVIVTAIWTMGILVRNPMIRVASATELRKNLASVRDQVPDESGPAHILAAADSILGRTPKSAGASGSPAGTLPPSYTLARR